MLEKIIIGVLEFLKSSEFTAVMATLLAAWQIIRGVVGKFASAKAKVKEKSYIEALLEKDKTIDKLLMKHELLEKLYLDNLEEIKTTRESITNMVDAQKIAFGNVSLNQSAKKQVLEILERKQPATDLKNSLLTPSIPENQMETEQVKSVVNKTKWVD